MRPVADCGRSNLRARTTDNGTDLLHARAAPPRIYHLAVIAPPSPIHSGCRFTTRVRLRIMKRPDGSAPSRKKFRNVKIIVAGD
jgi:hypothetical protein